ncbi:thiol-disulfide oxidoreductase DCC family protein [Chitinophaga sp. GCM10012297]|uniref:Thiol-disulfide oxidoreductase DCC family protein n=1 Tax=Chitinophaga chungangae TaxID=2821488 RepID=A0ABS3YI55_9BACT|nr:thiol-disulfide oxidoreductase DCC family protein [Chitinophaga chungangae]MBO9154370.1 thiol-disulfide oxidoreductase DCC family protein [Chitinophaga chungangae]
MEHAVILFDGVCNFCNASVNFLIRRDGRDHFRFAPLQSATGRALQEQYHFDPAALNTFILVENGKTFSKSTAALKVARRLGFPLNMTYAFIIVPRFLRDAAYNLVAKNRYKWFGKKESCMVPDERTRRKFL